MGRPLQTEIRMRLVVERPVAGVRHSLLDKTGKPVDARASAEGEAIAFEFAIRIAAGPKFFGEHVRSEGAVRCFVYIAVGKQAGDFGSCWSRRMKIDIYDIARPLLAAAAEGGRLEGRLVGTGADGSPVCATVPVIAWRVV